MHQFWHLTQSFSIFSQIFRCSVNNLKLCSKQYNKIYILHLIVAPQLSSGWQHNYSTKTRQTGCANEQSMYSLTSMVRNHPCRDERPLWKQRGRRKSQRMPKVIDNIIDGICDIQQHHQCHLWPNVIRLFTATIYKFLQ